VDTPALRDKLVVNLHWSATVIPPATLAKVLSPLKKVVASLVPVAVNLANDTELSASLAVVIVLSLTVPTFNTSPNTVMKSMLSEPVKAEANTILEPDIV
jgi:CMP-2-keto-3-deoxyoctulosonic acid synthetase